MRNSSAPIPFSERGPSSEIRGSPTRQASWRGLRCGALALATLLALAACTHKEAEEEPPPPVVAAATALAVVQPFDVTTGAVGSVVPRPGRFASLSAPVPSRVINVFVAAGQRVGAGQPLVQLDQVSVQSAASAAQSTLDAAQQAYDRASRLAREGIVPRRDVEQAAAELGRARAEAAAARRSAELSTLRSPIAGVVTRMSAVLGAPADPNQPLVDIADPSALDVVLGVTPSVAGTVHPGAQVTVWAGEGSSGERLGVGRVVDVGGAVDSVTRAVAVRVSMRSTPRPLRVGETVFGEIAVASVHDAVTVPLEALVPEGDGFQVFVVDSAGIAHARPVTIGGKSETAAYVSDGIKAGERVVTAGAYGVQEGAKIVAKSAAPEEKPEADSK